eukprot:Unigene1407_Nuclearia_a/m.4463 Unigene1407_Nuclearia_a/g.4463  ORF Unigene1407_Nuclearia_a/g.4463 Unigene1407_Nuclearia_a/m.4463 type:complete len:397 (+) Unigene1407_Nuclearia_a:121-1311(+)
MPLAREPEVDGGDAPPGEAKDDLGDKAKMDLDAGQLTEMSKLVRSMVGVKDLDAMRFSAPAFIHDTDSTVMRFVALTQPALFNQIADEKSPEARMIAVARLMLSMTQNDKLSRKKPFNPVIGETYSGVYPASSDAETIRFVAEQLEHHPPIGAFSYENTARKLRYQAIMSPEGSFTGVALKMKMQKTPFVLTVGEHDEQYLVTMPTWYLRGILWGKSFIDYNGTMVINCPKTGFLCEIYFKPKPWFFGKYRKVEGFVQTPKGDQTHTIKGYWDDVVYITHAATKEESVLFDSNIATVPYKASTRDEAGDMLATAVWEEVWKHITNKNFKDADKAKNQIEAMQRKYLEEVEKGTLKHTPLYFAKSEDGQEWNMRPDAFTNPAKAQGWLTVMRSALTA